MANHFLSRINYHSIQLRRNLCAVYKKKEKKRGPEKPPRGYEQFSVETTESVFNESAVVTNDCFCCRNAKVLIVSLKGIFCLNSPVLTNRDGNQNKTMNSPYSRLPFGCGGFIKKPPSCPDWKCSSMRRSPVRRQNSFSSRERVQAVPLSFFLGGGGVFGHQAGLNLCHNFAHDCFSCFSTEMNGQLQNITHCAVKGFSNFFCRQGAFF